MPALLAMYEVIFTFVNDRGEWVHLPKLLSNEEIKGKVEAAMDLGVYKVTAEELAPRHNVRLFKMWQKQGNGKYSYTAYCILEDAHE